MKHRWVHERRFVIRVVVCLFAAVAAGAETPVFQRLDNAAAASGPQLLQNAGFEEGQTRPLPGWYFWKDGYVAAPGQGRDGGTAIQCTSGDAAGQLGAGQTLQLEQTEPLPVIVTGWSRAENVSGPDGRGYAIYIDALYADGTPLWGVVSSFSTGTHDWEERRCVVLPEKPLRSITVYALFREHTGTVWFDDFALYPCGNREMLFFENVPVAPLPETGPPALPAAGHIPTTDRGLAFSIVTSAERPATALFLNERLLGHAPLAPFVRDLAADSDFVMGQPAGDAAAEGPPVYEWNYEELALTLRLEVETGADCIRLRGALEDRRGSDRAITVYVPVPLDGDDWTWWRDMRRSAPARAGVFMNTHQTSAGATGQCSLYPLAALSGPNAGIALATPMTEPRHCRLVYAADAHLLFAAFDLGLAPDTAKFPQRATFETLLYAFDPAWGFRAALERYYALFPACFEKRVDREGLWMAFTDISTVRDAQDFGFAFKEGTDNVPWDEEHGILTFVYTEPMTTWLPLPEETPREEDAALAHLTSLLEGDPSARGQASVTVLSSIHGADGRPIVYLRDTPWCDGALFPLNADPDLPVTEAHPVNQAQREWSHLERSLAPPDRDRLPDWSHYEAGYRLDSAVFASGQQALRVSLAQPGKAGAVQSIAIDQAAPAPLVLRARVKSSALTGVHDNNCAVYVDLIHTDGTPLWGQCMPIPADAPDFVTLERTLESGKPFRQATVYLLMRGTHTGTVWVDDVFLGEAGTERNLIADPGFEGTPQPAASVDGVYIDSFVYFASTLNYRRDHFASADLPLVFDHQSRRVGILTVFSTFEFERDVAAKVHSQGKFMMANASLHGYAFPAGYLDVLGTETDWFPEGEWQPMTDESMAFRRALCRQKPYCFLLNTHYADVDLTEIERYMQRCLFYGMYPGFFSENASTDCFFENPEWYEPARPLFKKYIPLLRMIGSAGWQAVTHARADGGAYIERYGEPESGALFFSLLNESPGESSTRVTIDLASLALAGKTLRIQELVTGTTPPSSESQGQLRLELVLPPHSARLLSLTVE